jgi:hypothetical protein
MAKQTGSPASPIPNVSFDGMSACIEDSLRAALESDSGPAFPKDYNSLKTRVSKLAGKFPKTYFDSTYVPFVSLMKQFGQADYKKLLSYARKEPHPVMDAAQAILQQGEQYAALATDAFQEMVNDLYDGFLSAEDRRGVLPPDRGVIPPIVKWGYPDAGPYTFPADAMENLGIKNAIVSMPPANSRAGLFSWAALAHETAGHDILNADNGLLQELSVAITDALEPLGHDLDQYWSERIDETASDVMGILNMGPAAAMGLIVYFRALNAAYTGDEHLRSDGPDDDPHPADILRGYLAAETVGLLKFDARAKWKAALLRETEKDVAPIRLGGIVVPKNVAIESAARVAKTLVQHKCHALENQPLGQIQNWRNTDERKVSFVRSVLRGQTAVAQFEAQDLYAAYVVSAATMEALDTGANLHGIFIKMMELLKILHNINPAWGPDFMTHRGNLVPHRLYVAHDRNR